MLAAVAVTDVDVLAAVTACHDVGLAAAFVAESLSEESLVLRDCRAETKDSVFVTLLLSRVCGRGLHLS